MKFIATSYLIYVRLKIRRNVQSVKKLLIACARYHGERSGRNSQANFVRDSKNKESRLDIIALGVVLFFPSFENLRISRNCYLANSSPRRFHFKRLLLQAISG